MDPLTYSYPELTPYQFASNTPIWAADLDGLEAEYRTDGSIWYKVMKSQGFTQIVNDLYTSGSAIEWTVLRDQNPETACQITGCNRDDPGNGKYNTNPNLYEGQYLFVGFYDVANPSVVVDATITATSGIATVSGNLAVGGAYSKTTVNVPVEVAKYGSWEGGSSYNINSKDLVTSTNPGVDVSAQGGVLTFNGLINGNVGETLANTPTSSATFNVSAFVVLQGYVTKVGGDGALGNNITGIYAGGGVGLSLAPVGLTGSTSMRAEIIYNNILKNLTDSIEYAEENLSIDETGTFEEFLDNNTTPIDETNN